MNVSPADGWFSLGGLDTVGNKTKYGFVMRRSDRFGIVSRIYDSGESTGWCNGVLSVTKGTVVSIFHNMVAADSRFRFYYAEGSSPTV